MANSKSRLRAAAAVACALLLTPIAGYFGYQQLTGNIHEVEASFYRSGQLGGDALQNLIAGTNIRTIINLRGAHPNKRWYARERSIAERNGIDYVPIALSAQSVPDMATMMRLAAIMRDAPKPLLVHCMAGADRTGLASAIYQLAADGKSVDEAAGQLSLVYGHFPWLGSRTSAMDRAFQSFAVAWNAEPKGNLHGTQSWPEGAR